MKVQRLLAGIVFGIALSASLADETGDTAEFEAAYSAYQEYVENKDYKRATPEAKKAYEISLRLFGASHQNSAALAYNYGLSLAETAQHDKARIDEARKILNEALKLYQTVYGKKSPELISVLMDLGDINARAFRPKKQKAYYKRALKIAREQHGQDSAAYGYLLLDAGVEMLNVSKSLDARQYLQDAHQTLQGALGDEHAATGIAAFQLARYEVARKKFSEAEGHLLAALKTFESPDRPSSPVEMSTHAWLVSVYEELGESEKATEHCLAIGRMTPTRADQDYEPLFRRHPIYPRDAQLRGKEGYVNLYFTVDQDGIVRDPVVVEGDMLFEDASLDAVKTWRYAPKFVDGQPVSTSGVLTKLTYKLSD